MNRHAFSLVEVLLALAVVALVMATLGPVLIGTLRTQRQARALLEPLAREQVAWAVLREDLLGVPLPAVDANGAVADLLAVPFTVTGGEVDGHRADAMQFCSCSQPPLHHALAVRPPDLGEATLLWSLRSADDGQGLAWTRRRQPHLLATGVAPEVQEDVILDHLGQWTVEVYSNGSWVSDFDSSQNGEVLPSLLRISYAYLHQDGTLGPVRVKILDLPQVGG